MSKYAGNIVTTGADAGYSVYFDGTGDYLSIADSAALDMGALDFTIECYVYIMSTPGTAFLFGKRANNATYGALLIQYSGNTTPILLATVNGSSWGVNITSTITTPLNTWAHLAVTRSGNTWTIWINGVSGGTTTVSGTVPDNASAFTIGAGSADGGNPMPSCYIANFRVVKGTALYTAAFTPPTQLLNITNTSLLTCNSPAIVDQSSNNFTITANGDAKVSTFTPFAGYQGFNPALGAAANGVWKISDASYYQSTRTWPIYDPYFNRTTLLLHGNSPTNVPTWITDVSTNNFAMTVAGDARAAGLSPFSLTTYPNSGSGYFDGNGDYISAAANTAFTFGSGAFTVEGWIYPTGVAATYQYIASVWGIVGQSDPTYSSWVLRLNTSNLQIVLQDNASGALVTITQSSGAVSANAWSHVAVVRNSNTVTLYLNGVAVGSGTFSATLNNPSSAFVVGLQLSNNNQFTGYISNLRIVKGAAVYTSGFTPSTAPLTAVSGTSLLTLQNSQSSNNNSFLDSSTNNFLITRNGNTTQGTFTPFSQTGWSVYSPGGSSNGSYLRLPNGSSATVFGGTVTSTSVFTIECWLNVPGSIQIFGNADPTANNTSFAVYVTSTGALQAGMWNGSSFLTTASTTTINFNTWTHAAWVFTAGTNGVTFYINGINAGSGNLGGQTESGSTGYCTFFGSNNSYAAGYFSSFRVTRSARYTANFTPSTQPLVADANTSLLMFQNSRLIDNSANNFAITSGGAPSVQAFSPFVPTYTTPITYSNWFDGSGDYLSTPDNAAFNLSTGAWTIEAFVYPRTVSTRQVIVGKRGASGGFVISWYLQISATGQVEFTNAANDYLSAANVVQANTWGHIAAVYDGTNLSMYYNGTRVYGPTAVTNNDSAASIYVGGSTIDSFYFNGCLNSVRVVKGTALYSGATITVPTGPLTAVSGTSLLTCQSSTFVDNSSNNFPLTAFGNVQPVASPNPFGFGVDQTSMRGAYSASLTGGSAYFDGSGDYLNAGDQTAYEFGAGDFSIEAWVYPTSYSASFSIASKYTAGNVATSEYLFLVTTAGKLGIALDGGGGEDYFETAAGVVPLNAWTHCAVSKSGTTIRLFVNGALLQTGTSSRTLNSTATALSVGVSGTAGYMSGFRLLKGTALYTSAFVPPAAPPTPVTNTQLLLNFTNGGMIDSTGKNVFESVGDAKISTAQSKWGGSSMYFDGTGDYLASYAEPAKSNANFRTGDFTVELWVYHAVNNANEGYCDSATNPSSGISGQWYLYKNSSNKFLYGQHGAAALITSTISISAGVWTHLAVCRSAGTTRMFINGVLDGSTTTSPDYNAAGSIEVGLTATPYYMNGYIDDLRITKGYARYIANFTPPTSQFQDQ